MRAACERTRERFPDLVAGPAGAEARQHLAGCSTCRESFESFESLVRELEGLGQVTAPDPGEGYWDGFAGSVRGRLESGRRSRSLRTLPAIAAWAAAIMLLVSLAALYAPGPPAGLSIDEAFETARRLPPEQSRLLAESTADLLGISLAGPDLEVDLDPEEVIEAIDRMRNPGGLTDLWHDQALEEMLLELDDTQAAFLKKELEGAGTPGPGRSL